MKFYLLLLFTTLFLAPSTFLFSQENKKEFQIDILWNESSIKGDASIHEGELGNVRLVKGKGKIKGNTFELKGEGGSRVGLTVKKASVDYGPRPTVVSVKSNAGSFSFFLRDVNPHTPIYIPDYGVMVLPGGDGRTYDEVVTEINGKRLATKINRIELEPEVSFEAVAKANRNMSSPIWLGISRDMRMFEVSEELEDMAQEGKIIRPKYATTFAQVPGNDHGAYIYILGRGVGVKNNIKRRLDGGSLPIYHSVMKDDDIHYHTISFVSFAAKPLTIESNLGTNYMVSDKHSHSRAFKEEHMDALNEKMKRAYVFDDEMVYYTRTTIKNEGNVPRYAFVKNPRPGVGWWYKKNHDYNKETGYSSFSDNQIFCVAKLDGKPLRNEEFSILLQPGETISYDMFMPHSPITSEKASHLISQSFPEKLKEARSYWKSKLIQAAKISLPENRIEEMLKAGLFHLDLITFGEIKDDVVSANVGVYSPIGTESSPIIQFYLSMGWFDLAKKALNYFLATQLKSGYIQNFEGYMVETGAALWTMGEYIRYTKDSEWLGSSKEKILKSCDFLIEWRNKNKKEELRGRGYGMIDGKVADPEDHYHQFMLNGYAYLGLSRMAEVLKEIDPAQSKRLFDEATTWKSDILETVKTLFSLSPVVPLGDGRWVPTLPPWAEAEGPRALFQKEETYWSHGTFTGADALLGPLYLVFCELIDAESKEARMLLDYHSELFYQDNAAFSQPYYSRHNWLQAKLGMTKPFLSTYYNTFSAHADRETYSFWEHMYRLSPHKTHEEAWFLMETRWMLYMEEGDQLSIFKTIPRDWLKDGEVIELNNVKSYFGNLNVKAESNVTRGVIEATIELEDTRKPSKVSIRLPHPDNIHPKKVTGGAYDRESETITIETVSSKLKVKLEY